MKRNLRAFISMTTAAIALAVAPGVGATPKEGERAPDARVEDADGRPMDIRSQKGKTLVLFYEGKDSASQNDALKREVAKLVKTERFRSSTVLAAVGDVSDYDYWPVKGIVKDKIREEAQKAGWPIFCDWDGGFRTAYKLRRGVSNVIVIGKSGSVLFAASGPVDARGKQRLLDALRAEVKGS
jgi:predicted transcriptional regulator